MHGYPSQYAVHVSGAISTHSLVNITLNLGLINLAEAKEQNCAQSSTLRVKPRFTIPKRNLGTTLFLRFCQIQFSTINIGDAFIDDTFSVGSSCFIHNS